MKKEKQLQAFKLRKKKKSFGEIARLLGVSKSTISYWFKDVDWSKNIKEQLIEKSRKTSRKRLVHLNDLKRKKYSALYLEAEREATKEFGKLRKEFLFSVGLSLYWGEGDKNFANGRVRVSNADPKLLYVFNVFLQKICKVNSESIKAHVLLYPDISEEQCLKFWSEKVKISRDRFFKPTLIQGKHKTKKLMFGVCSINVSNKYLKKKILVWLDLFAKEF